MEKWMNDADKEKQGVRVEPRAVGQKRSFGK